MMQKVGSQPLGARNLPFRKAASTALFGQAGGDEAPLDAEATRTQAWGA
jgi:hypothetical protein